MTFILVENCPYRFGAVARVARNYNHAAKLTPADLQDQRCFCKEGTPYSHFAAQLLLIGAGIGLTVTAMTSALLGDS
jgi:hypothetical protein